MTKAHAIRDRSADSAQGVTRICPPADGSLTLRSATSRPPEAAGACPRNLLAACLAHALHDGYTDALYVFLPAWQAQFGLSYAALAGVRALYSATMGGLQAPVHAALRKLSPRAALVLSTAVAAAGLLLMALPLGLAGLCAGLIVAGAGSSLQHPAGIAARDRHLRRGVPAGR